MFDRAALQAALAVQGTVVRVVIAEVKGSSPREIGAAMLVWHGGQAGTIGGGALEHLATGIAMNMLAGEEARRFGRWPLGPAIGQCCGGAVALLFERFTQSEALPEGVFVRPVMAETAMPLAVKRLLAAQRGSGVKPAPQLVQGWFVEPVAVAARPLWIWGAGHVGRALVSVLAPLPDLAITWVDTAPERFPSMISERVTAVPVADPALLVTHAPRDAAHLVLTYSHALDLELCHRILAHGFASLGVIGSATKAARFRARLHDLGHSHTEIQRIACPIGDKSLGKHPQAIAIGMASALLKGAGEQGKRRGMAG
ncbi:xanthine dehydrogenase accessory protein XdhC [Gemmobacter lutimaris]|uniref:Xanthine dehydrogenase accessory protein XdhC n=1 Tax=Gemmobacter lutimaris TaxID=2306023 RepID=A0A398BT45_9RHOB|nr:xanthine dehydrogenase accessory protein XdhC [Gemmobacter lutimaris]RID92091.1 xanthine dehydrogenase accessory protein XdhC [Gemmobacter lutimaris]